jgi:hypothetical protein
LKATRTPLLALIIKSTKGVRISRLLLDSTQVFK